MALVLIPAARPFSQTLSSAALSGFLKKEPSEVHFILLFGLDLDPLLQTGSLQDETIVRPCHQGFRRAAAFWAKVEILCWAPACQWDICSHVLCRSHRLTQSHGPGLHSPVLLFVQEQGKKGVGESGGCHRKSITAVLPLLPIWNPLKLSSKLGKNSHLHQQIQELQQYASNQTSLLIFFN